ncbi:MAG: hypothetical protein EP329_01855 [Deltaproteobacteria bacterium]|nr:MAG: hypothetical protein EP329_01855 [Deltaproteobacteria bacterium]
MGAWIAASGNVVLATTAIVGLATPGGPGAIVSRLVALRWLILAGLLAQGVGLLVLGGTWLVGGPRPVARAAGAVWLGYVVLAALFVVGYVNVASNLVPVVLGASGMLLTGAVLSLVLFAGADREARGRGSLSAAAGALAVWAFAAVIVATLAAAVLLGSESWKPGLVALAVLGVAGGVALAAAGVAVLRPVAARGA